MSGWAKEQMVAWARERGLTFQEDGLLPPVGRMLHAGTGVGSHIAGIVVKHTAHQLTTTDGFTKRPERYSMHLCSGKLPGGVEGVLAHHAYLVHGLGSSDGSWNAVPHTVVLVRLPRATRALRDLKVVGGPPPDIKVGKTIDLSRGGAPEYRPATETVGGWRFTVDPPWDADVVRSHVATRAVIDALDTLGEDVEAEIHDGWLSVYVDQVWDHPHQLDWLCHAAARIAAAVDDAVAARPALDHATPLSGPRDSDQKRWIDEGVARVKWPSPPESVAAAKAAYADSERSGSRRRGRTASLIASGASLATLFLFGLIDLVLVLFGVPFVAVAAIIVVEFLLFAPFMLVVAWRAGGRLGRGDLENRSGQFGLAAFADGYARSRGLREEDRDELRYRLDPPLPGVPLRAWHGPLGDADGPRGRLAIWIDRTQLGTTSYALVAVIADPGGDVPETFEGYRVVRASGTLALVEQIAEADRSAARLDLIAAAARNVSLQSRDMLQPQPS